MRRALVTESTEGVSIENQQPFQVHATQEEVVLGGRTFILRAEATDSSGNSIQKTATLSIVDYRFMSGLYQSPSPDSE